MFHATEDGCYGTVKLFGSYYGITFDMEHGLTAWLILILLTASGESLCSFMGRATFKITDSYLLQHNFIVYNELLQIKLDYWRKLSLFLS